MSKNFKLLFRDELVTVRLEETSKGCFFQMFLPTGGNIVKILKRVPVYGPVLPIEVDFDLYEKIEEYVNVFFTCSSEQKNFLLGALEKGLFPIKMAETYQSEMLDMFDHFWGTSALRLKCPKEYAMLAYSLLEEEEEKLNGEEAIQVSVSKNTWLDISRYDSVLF